MKSIAVHSAGEFYHVKVDDDDFPVLERHKWYILHSGAKKRPYAFTRFYTEQDTKNGKTFLMHHLIMGTSGSIDHINNDSLDNRKENLRVATYQENGWNKPKSKTIRGKAPASPYKGVVRCVRASGEEYFRVLFKLSKKGDKPDRFCRMGPFETERDAALAYNEEVVKHRGQYAYLNQVV